MHSAPADAMMVVSDMGETWSPQMAPAIHADMEMMRSGAAAGNTAMQIGIRMPNVPHDVPVPIDMLYNMAPSTMPMNSDEYTSLVLSASAMATTGGRRDHTVPMKLKSIICFYACFLGIHP